MPEWIGKAPPRENESPKEISTCRTMYLCSNLETNLTSCNAGIYLHAQFLSLLPQPAHQITKTDDVIAMVTHGKTYSEILENQNKNNIGDASC